MAYVAQLKPDEALRLRRAYLWYHHLVAPWMTLQDKKTGKHVNDMTMYPFVVSMRARMTAAIAADPLITSMQKEEDQRNARVALIKNQIEKKQPEIPKFDPSWKMNEADLMKKTGYGPVVGGARGKR